MTASSRKKEEVIHTAVPLCDVPLLAKKEEEKERKEENTFATEEEEEEEVENHSTGGGESFCLLTVLPFFLFLQFGMAFLFQPRAAVHQGMSWGMVNVSIGLFVVTACMYRSVIEKLEKRNCLSTLCILLPEIVMDVVLALILFSTVYVAWIVLLVSMLVMALTVVVSSSVDLLMPEDVVECEEFYAELSDRDIDDELDLSQRDGLLRYAV